MLRCTFGVHYVSIETMMDIEIWVQFSRALMIMQQKSFILSVVEVNITSFSVIYESETCKSKLKHCTAVNFSLVCSI